jgi:hypothetical protein
VPPFYTHVELTGRRCPGAAAGRAIRLRDLSGNPRRKTRGRGIVETRGAPFCLQSSRTQPGIK